MGDEAEHDEPGSAPADTPGSMGAPTPPRLTEAVGAAAPPRLTERVDSDVAPPAGAQPVGGIDPDTKTATERGTRTSVAEQLAAEVQRLVNDNIAHAMTELKEDIQREIVSATNPSETAGPPPPTNMKRVEMDKTYDPHAIEAGLYQKWEVNEYFRPGGNGQPYCIMLPPPNVTGSLHMGHAFQDTLMDALIRYQRMCARNTLWQCGTDHAGIATQMVVERQLAARGVSRRELGREKFTAEVWNWKSESGGAITRQLRRMGASMDWTRERFTLDPDLSAAVNEVFVSLYHEGLIYRGKRLVNWDPVLHTAISDLEVVSEEEQGQLWHLKYPLADGSGHVIVATTRPETMLGDVAVAVHPEDDRYRRIIGKTVVLPVAEREIPVIADDYVDPEFGSGCVKITPAHDFDDYEVGTRHGLPTINIFTESASINDEAPEPYRGLDRFDARTRIVDELQSRSLVARIDDHKLTVPRGDRTHAVIEPLLTDQWFVRIAPLAEPAIAAVEDGRIEFVPGNWSKTYFEWMRNIKDWCISRQLWWGHRIPAWYDSEGNIYVGRDEEEARARAGLAASVALQQDTDVLDTWFSSALWPFSTLGWPKKTPELETFYPTSVLVTGFDIIFFWVARMIMMGIKLMGDVPFRQVYIHGLVRDADGNKMSKSRGNILDPIDLIDGIELEPLIAKRTIGLMRPQDAPKIEAATRRQFPQGVPSYGTDALRFTFASMATQGRDIRFDLGRIGGYKNFCNKVWNASRFVLMACAQHRSQTPAEALQFGLPERWIRGRLGQTIARVREGFEGYRFDLGAQALYEFVWDEYCDWYIELAKVSLNDGDADAARKDGTIHVLLEALDASLRALHPMMPFITEEIWLKLAPEIGGAGHTIMTQPYPQASAYPTDVAAETTCAWVRDFVSAVRRIRAEYDIDPGKRLAVGVTGGSASERAWLEEYRQYIQALARVDSITHARKDDIGDAATGLAGEMTLLVGLSDLIDRATELKRLTKEIKRLEDEIARADAKLANQSFVEKAPPEIVDQQRRRRDEAQSAARKIREQVGHLQ